MNLMQLCGFESQHLMMPSPWCDLFMEDEWPGFEVRGSFPCAWRIGYNLFNT